MEFILNTIFWTLALYGLYEIIKNIIYINTYTKFKSKGIYLIIGVKNQEDIIEGFLRSILFKILYGREEYFRNIIVADLESTDKTKEISKKLSKEYECLKVVSLKEARELMDNIDEGWTLKTVPKVQVFIEKYLIFLPKLGIIFSVLNT